MPIIRYKVLWKKYKFNIKYVSFMEQQINPQMSKAQLKVGPWCSREARAEVWFRRHARRNDVWVIGIDYCKHKLIYA